jgi:Tol biopolymer transport system component
MVTKLILLIIILLLVGNLSVFGDNKSEDMLVDLKIGIKNYGQKPPGITPELFAPGIVSTKNHEFGCCLSPDGKEFYFTRRHPEINSNRIMVTQLMDSGWAEPKMVPVAGDKDGFEPTISPDGKRLYYIGMVLTPQPGKPPMDVYYVERSDSGWGGPHELGHPFNPGRAMFISMTKKGTIYTTNISSGPGRERLVRSQYVDGKYTDYEPLEPPIASGNGEMYPYIAPDESYIIFTSFRLGGRQDAAMFVSFKLKNGSFGEPVKIETGLPRSAMGWVSADDQYLFFTSMDENNTGDIYWVSMDIIENLRPK